MSINDARLTTEHAAHEHEPVCVLGSPAWVGARQKQWRSVHVSKESVRKRRKLAGCSSVVNPHPESDSVEESETEVELLAPFGAAGVS